MTIRALVPMARVTNVPASIAFYEKLGFEVANTFTPSGASEPAWASLGNGPSELMLSKATRPSDPETVTFYLYVDDVAAKHAELTAAGVACGEIRTEFYAPHGEFRVVDPDGYVLMITHT